MEYKILYKDGRAKRAEMKTVHGTIQTPVFMNVGTVAAIKGAVSTDDPTVWRSAQIYELGSPDPHGFRRISGVFPGGTAED